MIEEMPQLFLQIYYKTPKIYHLLSEKLII